MCPKREIQEVRNAIKAYDQLEQWNPVKRNDLFSVHAVLMEGLLDEPGICRSIGVGVMNGKKVIYMAPPASRISLLMDDLLNWLEKTDAHPLISSSVFHYEFEFIHPFEDGNGRLGRLWQTPVLNWWNQMFANLPVESIGLR
ncbi:MAG: Fic family protein [Proteobacteria bacterium]|nr:Fic family protein [Pseudomonadota bacterium]